MTIELGTPLLTARDIAAWLRLTESTVYKMAARDELPVVRLGRRGRLLRFRREDVDQWLRQRSNDAERGAECESR